ncbi:Sbal_3080 family lipoprotein [Acinetobacter pittii]|uniref:Sbal_3080 family lipoprotein n=1 Tax=Acinetobacter pittii TaxID=48296 RepID=UPI002955281B|nr:Sbal_3080 family lipoprotein [Acinetobacter pittii]MDV7706731.1 Sbal_3080 family lipoprotein [Acinetobacter pittii]MDV7759779.1 Sbal_3080 family lipoprotein [Acinetobacter pittii]
MKKILGLVFVSLGMVGCTSIQINNATGFNPETIRQVCIVDNPKVIIKDFNQIVERSFARYSIDAKTYKDTDNLSLCQTTLNYTATRSWDFAPYMVAARFNLLQNGRQVSEASFNLRGNGGLALNKWRSTETKINELVDQLLNKAPAK